MWCGFRLRWVLIFRVRLQTLGGVRKVHAVAEKVRFGDACNL